MRSILYQKIYNIVKHIPFGHVATYGQIAVLAGIPGNARQVGYAMHALPDDSDVPWHRVVNARGEISIRSDPFYANIQRHLLNAEGVTFNKNGRISLEHFLWQTE
ncbi:MAG: MGMT family protein [Candidatus Marinimicrobia bacterium]|nr:MGMT family protein [Candidatus Neomarinimicrobiota bacterium]